MVLGAGLEPARIAPHAPQACVSANFTTRARRENGAYNTKIPPPPQGGIFRVLKVLGKSQKKMVQFPHFLEKKARWIMNFTHQTLLVLVLGGLLTGCVTPTDMGYVVPAEPVYSTAPAYTVPAYYVTPVSGYSTMTVYDGYRPRYGRPHFPHHRPPPPPAYRHGHGHGHGDRSHGAHGGPGGHGGHFGRLAPTTRSGPPTMRLGTPSKPAGGGRVFSGGPKRAPVNQARPPSRRPAPSRAPSGRGGGFGKGGGRKK